MSFEEAISVILATGAICGIVLYIGRDPYKKHESDNN